MIILDTFTRWSAHLMFALHTDCEKSDKLMSGDKKKRVWGAHVKCVRSLTPRCVCSCKSSGERDFVSPAPRMQLHTALAFGHRPKTKSMCNVLRTRAAVCVQITHAPCAVINDKSLQKRRSWLNSAEIKVWKPVAVVWRDCCWGKRRCSFVSGIWFASHGAQITENVNNFWMASSVFRVLRVSVRGYWLYELDRNKKKYILVPILNNRV